MFGWTKKNKDFWSTIKPFLTNKGSQFETDIILNENEKLVTNQKEISNVFNYFFFDVTKDIGKDSITIDENHSSIIKIKECSHTDNSEELYFKPISEDFIEKQINKLNVKKATGIDQISPKILKVSKPVVKAPIT